MNKNQVDYYQLKIGLTLSQIGFTNLNYEPEILLEAEIQIGQEK